MEKKSHRNKVFEQPGKNWSKDLQEKIHKFNDQFDFPHKKLKMKKIDEIEADVQRSGVV